MKGSDPQLQIKEIGVRQPFPKAIAVSSVSQLRISRVFEFFWGRLREERGAVNLTRLQCSELGLESLQKLRRGSDSLSLFSTLEIIELIEPRDLQKKFEKQLLQIISDVSSEDYSFFLNCSKPLSSGPIRDYSKSQQSIIDLEPLRGAEAERWVAAEFRREGVSQLSGSLIREVLHVAGDDLDRAHSVIGQFVLFLGDEKPSLERFQQIFPSEPSVGDFVLLDQLAGGDIRGSQLTLRSYLRQGKSPFQLIALLLGVYQDYIRIAENLSLPRQVELFTVQIGQILRKAPAALKSGSIAVKLAIPEWKYKKQLAALARYSLKDLYQAHHALIRAEAKLKNLSLEPESTVSEVLPLLVAGGGRHG